MARAPLTNTQIAQNPELANNLAAGVPPIAHASPTRPSGNAPTGTFYTGGHQSAAPAVASAGSSGLGQAVAVAQLHSRLHYDDQTPATPPSARELAVAQHHAGTGCQLCHAFLVGVARGSLHAAPTPAQSRRETAPTDRQRRAPQASGPFVSATVAERAAKQRAQRAAEQRPRTGARTL